MATETKELVEYLKSIGALKTKTIIDAFLKIDRAEFVPAKLKSQAYVDAPLPIGQGQTISQPQTVAIMLELLAPQPGQKVLDIGYGSGWTTALLAQIVGEKGLVIGLEKAPELCQQGRANVKKFFPRLITDRDQLSDSASTPVSLVMLCGNGRQGFAKAAPFDKIIAAAAVPTIKDLPKAWKQQLRTGGRLVAPAGEGLLIADKQTSRNFQEQFIPGFLFVPLQ